MRTPFFNGHAVARSTNFSDSKLINLYPEVAESKNGKDIGAFFPMPGLTQVATCGSGPINGILQLSNGTSGGGAVYVVSGTTLYALDGNFVATSLGAVNGSAPFSMIQNGDQLAIFGNGQGTSYSVAAGRASITMPFSSTGTIIASYQDGFGFIHQPGLNLIFQSDSLDLTSWPALNVASASGDPDRVVALAQTHRELYVIKQFETEIWTNQGTSPFAFGRLDGPYIEAGCIAPQSVAKLGESLIWLGQNSEGSGVVVQVDQFRPNRISTHTLESEIQGYATISDAIAYGYQYGGHEFYVLTFPTANLTWVYDKTTSELLKTPFWFQWLTHDLGGNFIRHLSNCFAIGYGFPLVGSYLDGTIYKLDPTAMQDGTFQRQWLRTWRALPKPSPEPAEFRSLTIDMETGATGTIGSPSVRLRWSDDGGHTWSSYLIASVGSLGNSTLRVKFNRLGGTRRNTGLDRIFEVGSNPILGQSFPGRIFGAELE